MKDIKGLYTGRRAHLVSFVHRTKLSHDIYLLS